jgi:hypothetical protein
MNPELEQAILKSSGSNQIKDIQLIQKLWSGYGSLNRIILNDKTAILKLIKFPESATHPRGWNNDLSHLRKEKSYQVEMNWYENHNELIEHAYSPRLIAKGSSDSGERWILLEDLQKKKFTPKYSLSSIEIERCLKWLANFHSHYLGHDTNGLWPIGTYWHLDTRPDELKVLEDSELKKAAPLIDQKLNSAKYKTFVHGDAKLANFLFNDTQVAAVDFQYIGGGVGIKDVAYFLSSVFDESELEDKEEECLNVYFQELNNSEVEKEWRDLYPWAWCDFYRFLQGWAPGHYKLNSYSEKMKNKVLSWI